MVTKGHASGRSPLSYPTAGPGSARTSDHDFLDDLTRALGVVAQIEIRFVFVERRWCTAPQPYSSRRSSIRWSY